MYYFIKRFVGKVFENNEPGEMFLNHVFPYEMSKFRRFFSVEELAK